MSIVQSVTSADIDLSGHSSTSSFFSAAATD